MLMPRAGVETMNAVHTCPNCGSENTRHYGVDAYSRIQEDGVGHHARVDHTGVTVDTDLSRNPSTRRDGIRINLWCEECNFVHDLEIKQHKGQTLFQIVNIRSGGDAT